MDQVKICRTCKKEQPISNFHKGQGMKYGVRSDCKNCRSIEKAKYREKNIDKIKISGKEYRKRTRAQKKLYDQAHWPTIVAYKRSWYNKNRLVLMEKFKSRFSQDLNLRLRCNLRSRIHVALKRGYKSGSAVRDLGCSIEELKIHLASQFREGMSWENYGKFGWTIDHILPLNTFDLTDREQFLKACHYTNLQPLWCWENSSKGDKVA